MTVSSVQDGCAIGVPDVSFTRANDPVSASRVAAVTVAAAGSQRAPSPTARQSSPTRAKPYEAVISSTRRTASALAAHHLDGAIPR